jgi:L-alanine-DL-glutamate epimerase-like enolase superfamily enzyme
MDGSVAAHRRRVQETPQEIFHLMPCSLREPPMKITDVEAIYVSLPEVTERCDSGQDALIVKVHTEGITGIGEVDSAPLAAQGMILGPYSHTLCCGLKHLPVDEDPFETEFLWEKMFRGNIYAGRHGMLVHAISDIDIALWDIKGKKLGMRSGSFLEVEYVSQGDTNLRNLITKQKILAKDGFLQIPEEPGLGLDLNEEMISKYRVS